MKILIPNGDYTFDASAKTISLDSYGSIELESVLLVTNLVDGIIIYNFADSAKGGTVATNVLTLEYDTTSMSDTDELQIWYEDPTASLATTISAALPAGTNNIGDVDVLSLPALAAGTNNIGDVDVLTLPSLPAGTNNIGDVDVLTLPTLPAGDNNIGNVDIVTLPGDVEADIDQIRDQIDLITPDIDAIRVSTELIDDAIQVLGTDTYTEASSKGMTLGAVRRDADTTLVGTTNEFGPLQMDANGRLKVEIFDGGDSHTVDGTVSVTGVSTLTEQQTQTTALQLIDDIVYTDDTSTHATGTSKGALFMAAATPTDSAINANDIGAVAMTVDRKLHVAVMDALPAGTAAIGKLAANSGIDIGDVDILSVIPGTGATNLGKAIDTTTGATDTGVLLLATRDDDLSTLTPIDGDNVQLRTDSEGALWVTPKPSPLEGALTINSTSSDGGTALTSTAQAIKASAGCVYGYYIYNPNSSAQFVQFYNTAAGSVTVGTTNPLFMLTIPATSGANLFSETGIQFTTAMSWAATNTAGGNGAPSTALDAVCWYK